MGNLDDLRKELDDAIDNLKKVEQGKSSANQSDALRKVQELKTKSEAAVKGLSDSDSKVKDLNKSIENATKAIGGSSAAATKELTNLKTEGNDIDSLFSNIFGNLYAGLNKGNGSFQNITASASEFAKVLKNVDGENVAFWREYDRRIREVGVTYGISGKKLDQFREGNLNLEKEFVRTGNSIEDLKYGIDSLFESTGQVNQLTPEFSKNLGNISRVMGLTVGQTGTLLGSFNNLGLSFNTTTKLLEDLRYSAEKSALNTQKVLKTFSDNFEKLNTFAFKNGVQGMMEMVKQSQALKINMDSVLNLADSFTDPEQTMQFAANMQLLGGSFAQLGDFNQLMYDAAVAPEELAKNIARATAGMGQFNRETGKLDISFADKMQLKEAAKLMGMTVQDLQKMSTIQAKIADMKSSLNFKPLSEDQLNTLASVAQFNTKTGQYEVKVGGEMKSVASLSDEDIDKLSEVGEQQTFEQLNVQKMDVPEIIATNLQVAKFDTLDLFKSMGMTNDNLKAQVNESARGIESAFGTIKEKFLKPIEDFAGGTFGDTIAKTLKNLGDGASIAFGMVKGALDEFKKSPVGQAAGKVFDEGVEGIKQGLKEKGGILNPDKYEEGKILEGLSHKEGGIPFTVGGRPGFEAEGGEVLLTKGVSQDPMLLSIASKLNETAGGKKLYEDGGLVDNKMSTNTVNQTNNSILTNTFYNENVKNISNLTKQTNSSIRENIQKSEILNENITNVYGKLNESLEKFTIITTKNLNEIKLDFKSPFTEKGKVVREEKVTSAINEKMVSGDFSKVNELISSLTTVLSKGDFGKDFEKSMGDLMSEFKNIKSNFSNLSSTLNFDFKKPDIKTFEQAISNISSVLKTDMSIINDKSKNIDQSFTNVSSNLTDITSIENKNKETIKSISEPIGSLGRVGFGEYGIPDFRKTIMDQMSPKDNTTVNKDKINEQTFNNLSNFIKYENVNKSESLKQIDQVSNIFSNRNENITKMMDNTQGGLVEKRGDITMSPMGVNGDVKVSGKIDPIIVKVTIEGTNSTKEMVLSDDKLQNKIHSIVSERINSMNIYTQMLTKKDTGIDSGKKPVIHGITDVGERGVASWFG